MQIESLESRVCLSTAYDFSMIAKTGEIGLTGTSNVPSINDAGKVAFVGQFADGNGIVVGDGTKLPTNINPNLSHTPSLTFSPAVQINNTDRVVAVDRNSASGYTSYQLRTWNADATNAFLIWESAGIPRHSGDHFDAISSFSTINNTNEIVSPSLISTPNTTSWNLQYQSSIADHETIGTFPAPQSLRPMAADGEKVVARAGNVATSPIDLYSRLPGGVFLTTSIAGASTGFTALGQAPGISEDGKVIAFYGERSPASGMPAVPGIFASVLTPDKGRVIVQVAGISGNNVLDPGETFTDLNHNGVFDSGEGDTGPITALDPNARVDANDSTILFTATDASGHKAIFTATLNLADPTNPDSITFEEQTEVVSVGQKVHTDRGDATIADLAIDRSINTGGQVAFWASTDIGSVVLRANPLRRPIIFLPGIAGDMPTAATYSSWLTHRGVDPETLQIDPLAHSYDDAIQTLVNAGYRINKDLFIANYDWRLPVGPDASSKTPDGNVTGIDGNSITSGTFNYGVDYLGYYLKKAATQWDTDHPGDPLPSVDIIAHSTGGLVARTYIQSAAYNAPFHNATPGTTLLPKVDNLIMVGVPNQGASKAYNVLNDNWIENKVYYGVFRSIVRLAYLSLFPSDPGKPSTPITGPTPGDTITQASVEVGGVFSPGLFIQKYVPTLRNLMATYNFYNATPGQPPVNVNGDPNYANDQLLNLNGNTTDVNAWVDKVQNAVVIYGTGVDTATTTTPELGHSYGFTSFGSTPDIFPLVPLKPHYAGSTESWYHDDTLLAANPMAGDGTVPQISSVGLYQSDSRFTKYDEPGVDHQGLTADPTAQKEILDELDLSLATPISTTLSKLAYLRVGLTVVRVDPVDALLVDDQGKKLGYTAAGGPVTDIPNSLYLGGGNGVGFVIGDASKSFTLQLTGLGQTYSVGVWSQEGSNYGGVEQSGFLAAGATKSLPVLIAPVKPPIGLQGTAINDGGAQRSMVNSLTVTFLTPVAVAPGGFVLTSSTAGVQPPTLIVTPVLGGGGLAQTYKITFAGPGIIGGSLGDGRYTLTILPDSVHDGSGQSLTGINAVDFFRLFGDIKGTGVVDNQDIHAFAQSYGSHLGDVNYIPGFDYFGTGVIAMDSLTELFKRRNKHI